MGGGRGCAYTSLICNGRRIDLSDFSRLLKGNSIKKKEKKKEKKATRASQSKQCDVIDGPQSNVFSVSPSVDNGRGAD